MNHIRSIKTLHRAICNMRLRQLSVTYIMLDISTLFQGGRLALVGTSAVVRDIYKTTSVSLNKSLWLVFDL